jgi:hypothetical protein
MARIALPHRHADGRSGSAVLALLLFASAAALAGVLSMVHVPSTAAAGLPSDWGQRAAWLAVEALVGLGAACLLVMAAERVRSRRSAG